MKNLMKMLASRWVDQLEAGIEMDRKVDLQTQSNAMETVALLESFMAIVLFLFISQYLMVMNANI